MPQFTVGLDAVRQTTRTWIDQQGLPENDLEWTVDLKAERKSFAAAPTTLDFDYGLHMLATLDRDSVDEGDLARMLDFAAMWDVRVPPASALAEVLGKKAQIRVQLVFEHEQLLAAVANPRALASWASPLAMAMPYMSRFAERRSYAARQATYISAWAAWLAGRTNFSMTPPSGIIQFERNGGPGSFRWTSGEGHAHLRSRLDAFLQGVQRLHAAMTTPQEPQAIGAAYDGLQQFWSQRLYVAAAGRWLLDRAPGASRSLQVDLGDTTITV